MNYYNYRMKLKMNRWINSTTVSTMRILIWMNYLIHMMTKLNFCIFLYYFKQFLWWTNRNDATKLEDIQDIDIDELNADEGLLQEIDAKNTEEQTKKKKVSELVHYKPVYYDIPPENCDVQALTLLDVFHFCSSHIYFKLGPIRVHQGQRHISRIIRYQQIIILWKHNLQFWRIIWSSSRKDHRKECMSSNRLWSLQNQ